MRDTQCFLNFNAQKIQMVQIADEQGRDRPIKFSLAIWSAKNMP
jgi:hypothetical protein